MQQWWDLFKNLDVIVAPNSGQLGQTNLTGNPAVIIPNGFREAPPLGPPPAAARPDSTRPPGDTTRRAPAPAPTPRPLTPVSLTFLGPLYHEERPLAL